MKFTVDTHAFVRMLQILGESSQGRKPAERAIILTVNRGRVVVAGGDKAAEIEATVWQDGQCTVSRIRLMKAAKSSAQHQPLTITFAGQALRVGDSVLPVLPQQRPVPNPQRYAFFLTTGLATTASEFLAHWRLAGAA